MARDRDTDRGYQEIKRRWMNHANGAVVVVGVFGPDNLADRGLGVTNVMLASVHEFGTQDGRVPARKPLRTYVDEQEQQLRRLIRVLTEQYLAGKLAHDAALGQLGAKVTGGVQSRIAKGLPPPLAPSTLAARRPPDPSHGPRRDSSGRFSREGSAGTTPLIDTGQLRAAYGWEVRRR